jgi:hypothetical protein
MSEGCVWARCASWMAFLSPFVAEDHKVCTLTHFLRTNGISSCDTTRTGRRSIPYTGTVKAKSRVTVHENVFVFEIKPGFCYKKFHILGGLIALFLLHRVVALWVVAATPALYFTSTKMCNAIEACARHVASQNEPFLAKVIL